MSLLTDFLNDVRPDVPDCLEKIMIDAIRQSAIKLCEEAPILVANLAPITLSSGVSEYTMPQPTDKRVIAANDVFDSQGIRLSHLAINRMQANSAGLKPSFWGMVNRDTIRLYPTPNAAGDNLTINAVLKPSQTCTTVDDFLFEDYRIGIAAGAKASLMAMPAKEWTNFELAGYYKSLFADCVSDARVSIATNFSGAPMQVRPVRFG